MKKNALLSMAILSAVVAAGITPLASNAAEVRNIQCLKGNGYQVYIGQGNESLSEILKELYPSFENIGTLCPDTDNSETQTPEVSAPDTSQPPVTEEPDTQIPDTDTSEGNTELSYAEQVVALVNEERAKAGLSALTMDADITAAANVRAKEIKQSFSHTRPNGSSFSTVLKEQGVSFRGSGENIAWGQKTPEQVMDGWMNSAGHRANILNESFKNIGVGYYQDENGVNHWVQLFTY